MSQGNSYDQQSLPPVQQYPNRSGSGRSTSASILIIAAVLAVPMLLICVVIVFGLLLPATSANRDAARRVQCSTNLKQIALAMQTYNAVYAVFPPAFTTDSDGKPLHSWRTLLLPYMDQQSLYSQIDLSIPWDDPANLQFSKVVVPTYGCPSGHVDAPEKTCYQAVVDPSGIFTGATPCAMDSIADGLSNTLLVFESDSENSVPWMSPEDSDLPMFLSNNLSHTSNHEHGGNTARADGLVSFLLNDLDPANVSALVTKAGGEIVYP